MDFIILLLILPFTICCIVSYFIARYTFRKLVLASHAYSKAWSIFTFVVTLTALCAAYTGLFILFVPFGRR
jgi:H+/Cl- antiporter ClcA